MASRVVPGTSDTIARSSPSSALSRLDLPTFGPPDERDRGGLAVRLGGHRGVPAGGLGIDAVEIGRLRRRRRRRRRRPRDRPRRTARAARRRPRRPTPRPRPRAPCARARPRSRAAAPRRSRRAGRRCRGRATPRSRRSPPSRARGTRRASSSRFSLSALLTTTITGALARRRMSAASRSAGRRARSIASTTNRITSASAIASRACSWTRASIGSSGSSSRPPVSTMTKRRPFHSVSP